MKRAIQFRDIATASALLLGLATAQASVITTPIDQIPLSGAASLSFSGDLLGALDTGKVSVTAYGAAISTITKDNDGFYTGGTVSAPLTTLTYDPANFEIFGMGSTGGLTMTAPILKNVSSGGSLTVTDLRADLSAQTIYATVIGGNGVGTISDMALWHFSGLSSQRYTRYQTIDTSFSGLSIAITGLTITQQGFNAFTQSLGLLTLGKSALMGVTDYGTITSTIEMMDAPNFPWSVTSVPEPSTYALMGLGLAGLVMAAKRRRSA